MSASRMCILDEQDGDSKLFVVASSSEDVDGEREVTSGINGEEPTDDAAVNEMLLDDKKEEYEVVVVVDECGVPVKKERAVQRSDPISCDHCGKSFNTRAYLKVHIRGVHMGLKPHVCKECGKAFSRTSLLSEHMRLHSDSLPFACTQCDRRFRWKSSLHLHMQTHNDVHAYACPHCPETFRWRISLRRHMTEHGKVAPHSCGICGKTFWEAYGLNQHARVHTGERPFPCPLCKRTFRWKHQVTSHACRGSALGSPGEAGQEALSSHPAPTQPAGGVATVIGTPVSGISPVNGSDEGRALSLAKGGFSFAGVTELLPSAAVTAPQSVRIPITTNILSANSSTDLLSTGRPCLVNGEIVPTPMVAVYNSSVSATNRHPLESAATANGHYGLRIVSGSMPSSTTGMQTPLMSTHKLQPTMTEGGNSSMSISTEDSRGLLTRILPSSLCGIVEARSATEREHAIPVNPLPGACHVKRRRSSIEVDHCYSKSPFENHAPLSTAVPFRAAPQSVGNSTPSCELTRLRRSTYDMPGPPVVTVLSDGNVRTSSGEKRRLTTVMPPGAGLAQAAATRHAQHRAVPNRTNTQGSAAIPFHHSSPVQIKVEPGTGNFSDHEPLFSVTEPMMTSSSPHHCPVSSAVETVITSSSSAPQTHTDLMTVQNGLLPHVQRTMNAATVTSADSEGVAGLLSPSVRNNQSLVFNPHPLPDVQLGKAIMF